VVYVVPNCQNHVIVGCLSVALDISAQQQAARTVKQLKRDNELILNAAGEGIFGLDLHGKATFVNPAAVAMTGWTREDLIGKSIHEYHHHTKPNGLHYPLEECPIYMATRDGAVHHVDTEVFWRKDGSCFPVDYTSTPIYEEGRLAGAVVVFRDISERKRVENELKSAFHEVKILKERLKAENSYLQEEIKTEHNFEEIIGHSASLKQVIKQIAQVSPTDATVLIQGESGTGKELVARAIHNLSSRKNHSLIKVNCAAISAGLVESELFGHEKGAFTGALQRRIGRFELAHEGTIFLDEIGELPFDTQVKLLRVLQEQEFERVGSSQPIKVNVRIIAATNRNLAEMAQTQEFRQDLFYRLNVFPIDVPPLRERSSDIPLLVNHFLTKAGKKFGKSIQGITPQSLNSLMRYAWPGNIRELQNVIERAVIVAQGALIETEALSSSLLPQAGFQASTDLATLAEVEAQHILQVLQVTDWVIAGEKGAAKILAMHPNTLRSRMQKLGIKRTI